MSVASTTETEVLIAGAIPFAGVLIGVAVLPPQSTDRRRATIVERVFGLRALSSDGISARSGIARVDST